MLDNRRATPPPGLLTRLSVVALLLLVAIAAAVQGTPGFHLPSYLDVTPGWVQSASPSPSPEESAPPPQPLPEVAPNQNVQQIIQVIGIMIAIAAVIAVCWVLWRWLRQLWQDRELRRREGATVAAPLGSVAAEPAVPDAPTVQRGLAGAIVKLESGAPTEAIVAAWLGLEDTAAESGIERGAAETAGEFAVRIIARHDGVSHDATQLLRLYESVRFGARQADEADRANAREILARIEKQWH